MEVIKMNSGKNGPNVEFLDEDLANRFGQGAEPRC
jgi:hypothetical protein